MIRVIARTVLVACLSLIMLGTAVAATEQARAAALAFYAVYGTLQPGGVPSRKILSIFRPVVSVRLFRLLQRADRAELVYAARHPNSPPMVEGDLFTSLFEGASRYRIEDCQAAAAVAACTVALTNIDPRSAEAFTWRDRVFMIREHGIWRVDDIEFGGTWEFMHKGRLQALLKSVIRESRSS